MNTTTTTTAPPPPPFSGLEPGVILDAIDSLGLRTDGRLLALNSFENRVYQVGLEDELPVVVKFYRPGRWSDEAILEEHRFLDELAREELPVVAPSVFSGATLHHHQGFRFAVSPRRGGRAPELDRADTLEWMGRFIARLHLVGARAPFARRQHLDVATFGESPREFLLTHDFLPPEVAQRWREVSEQALDAVRDAFGRVRGVQLLRLHGDCHPGNVLWTDAGPHFVDFDDCLTGPAVQDLWMLLSGCREEVSEQLVPLLRGYRAFRPFNEAELALIEPLRTLRLIHYSAWLARRWTDPAFPAAFPFFNSRHYWQERVGELAEQVALMAMPPVHLPR